MTGITTGQAQWPHLVLCPLPSQRSTQTVGAQIVPSIEPNHYQSLDHKESCPSAMIPFMILSFMTVQYNHAVWWYSRCRVALCFDAGWRRQTWPCRAGIIRKLSQKTLSTRRQRRGWQSSESCTRKRCVPSLGASVTNQPESSNLLFPPTFTATHMCFCNWSLGHLVMGTPAVL